MESRKTSTEPPKQPYILAFEGGESNSQPLALMIGGRSAVPLFDSDEKARRFLESTSLDSSFSPVEVSTPALISTLGHIAGEVEYIAINPPPANERGMRVRMGSLQELIAALRESRDEVNLIDFLGGNDSEDSKN